MIALLRPVVRRLCLAVVALCLPFIGVAADIDDAPVDEPMNNIPPLFKQQTAATLFDTRLQTRLYTISILDYAHIKSTASSIMINNGLVRERSASQQLNGEVTYKPSNVWTIKGDMQAQYSTAYDKATSLYAKGAQDWLKLNELFVEYYATNSVSLLAGKHRRVFGPGIFQNPMDRHNPVSAMPGQPLQREGTYITQLSIEHRFDYFAVSDAKLSFALLPSFYQDKNGLPSSHVSQIHFDEAQSLNNSIMLQDKKWTRARAGGFVRAYGNVFNGDANVVYYDTESQSQLGVSYARYIAPWLELHGESLLYNKPHYTPLVNESIDERFMDYLLGVRWELDQNQGAIFEYLHQGEQPTQFSSDAKAQRALITRLLDPSLHRLFITPLRDYTMMSLYTRNIRDTYSFTANAVVGVTQKEFMTTLRGDMKVGSQASIALTVAYTAGEMSSFYAAAIPNDFRLTSEIQIVF